MKAPQGIAKFDSAAAMSQALARFLHGRDFPGLGQPKYMQTLVRGADLVPRHLRERIFAHLGAQESVRPGQVAGVHGDDIAEWLTGLYPQRRYPAVMIGSSNGALVHLAAALGIPWLAQTWLALVWQPHVRNDDPVQAMEAAAEAARRFLRANPDSQLHHMHDPSQDRLMLSLVSYFRAKFQRLPPAYHSFLEHALPPGGTIYVVECEQHWPTTRLGERHVFQFGAVGGATTEEYFGGSERVAAYLERYDAPVRRWSPPPPDGESPEAEWGFEPALREELIEYARSRGWRVVRLVFAEPEDPSPLIADLYRAWHTERGTDAGRLVIESFVVIEPYWTLRTGSAPYWMTFNMQPSLERVSRFLDEREPFDEIYLTLFAHGVDSVGLPPIEAWQRLLARARRTGDFLGLDPRTYPAHFAHFGRYSQRLRSLPGHCELPEPLPLERVERCIAGEGGRHGVRIEEI